MPDFKSPILLYGVPVWPNTHPLQRGVGFPSSPSQYDLFHRNDLGIICEWDGTRWLGPRETIPMPIWSALPPHTADAYPALLAQNGAVVIYRMDATAQANALQTLANHWNVQLYADASLYGTGVTTGIAANVADIVSIVATTYYSISRYILLRATPVGSPGNLYISATITLRRVYT